MWTRYKSYYIVSIFISDIIKEVKEETDHIMTTWEKCRHIKAGQSGSPESDCSHKNKKIKNLKS